MYKSLESGIEHGEVVSLIKELNDDINDYERMLTED